MVAFNPSVLKPAMQVAELNKAEAGRTTKDVALANIDKQIAMIADSAVEGKRSYRTVGDKTAFTIRVANQALVLETVKVKDTTVEVKEMAVPTAQLKDAFTYYRQKVEAGDYDAQLDKLGTARLARTEKLKTTRANKKAAEKPKV